MSVVLQEFFKHYKLNAQPDRGQGVTALQMVNAPIKAVFVWCNEELHYPRTLAAHLNRTDLLIVDPSWLTYWTGYPVRWVTIDHACKLTERQMRTIDVLRRYGR